MMWKVAKNASSRRHCFIWVGLEGSVLHSDSPEEKLVFSMLSKVGGNRNESILIELGFGSENDVAEASLFLLIRPYIYK